VFDHFQMLDLWLNNEHPNCLKVIHGDNRTEFRITSLDQFYLEYGVDQQFFAPCVPHSSHRTTVQRIFRYLKHTPEFGIWYFASSSLDLVGFFDTDFVSCGIDQKSSSDICHFFGSSLVY
jgi:hypothetical protein